MPRLAVRIPKRVKNIPAMVIADAADRRHHAGKPNLRFLKWMMVLPSCFEVAQSGFVGNLYDASGRKTFLVGARKRIWLRPLL